AQPLRLPRRGRQRRAQPRRRVRAGYSLWHLTVGRRLGRHLELQGGAFNLFDLRRPALMPFQPGRRWFVTLTVHV
ncbi:TonB-dependent receptor, partial [Rhodothermus marinus]|uniref:TonB-dependent receptor n=1 Tax=Rhodothermus marinus TaxID=29549 RepID=UPI001FB477F5